ncbi:MAG: S26 family signal peptidase [bacterium]
MTTTKTEPRQDETNVIETVQSITVAFGIAMAGRAFVTEGFFIPTGSMAPTLMGQHARITGPFTGYEYPVDAQLYDYMRAQIGPNWSTELRGMQSFLAQEQMLAEKDAAFRAMSRDQRNEVLAQRTGIPLQTIAQTREIAAPWPILDPMISTTRKAADVPLSDLIPESAAGDRVLVLKYLYNFMEPQRWDVVVFKNPTNPTGDDSSYIKRLVGLPEEQLLILDGDVFTAPLGAPRSEFRVARKPEYVQRAVWQTVHDSDYAPPDPGRIATSTGAIWQGPPWEATGLSQGTKRNDRAWRADSAARSTLVWRNDILPINDFALYNQPRVARDRGSDAQYNRPVSVADIRVAAAIEADDPSKLKVEYALAARQRTMRFTLEGGKATIEIERSVDAGGDSAGKTPEKLGSASASFDVPAMGAPFDVEFWHVDERLSAWINGEEVVAVDATFASLEDRLQSSFFGHTMESYTRSFGDVSAPPARLAWSFEGSPLTLRRVRVDRDLYYRAGSQQPAGQFAENGPFISGAAFGVDFNKPAELKADQFMMCGDNSCASKDSRLWGRPNPLVTATFGEDAPFIVPRPLLLGKAWCVYFPAPVRPTEGAYRVVPDFGHLRFIR